MKATVQRGGFFTTVQDLGRSGFRRFGVSLGGALDSLGLRLANLLVGNDENSAGLEVAFGGLRLRFDDERIVAWCGGDFPVRIGSIPLPAGHAGVVKAGEEVSIDAPKMGFRAWLAVSGGFDVPVVLGSRSTDSRSGFGGWQGRTVRDGDEIPLGENGRRTGVLLLNLRDRKIGYWKPPHPWTSPASAQPIVRFVLAADWLRFGSSSREAFTTARFVVSSDSDRMGVRLAGPVLERTDHGDLLSEVVAPGTVQVPSGGQPILLLGDCQTIGGYPKIAHVITVDLPIAAQLRPGDAVSFKQISLTAAHELLLMRETELGQFRCGLASQFLWA